MKKIIGPITESAIKEINEYINSPENKKLFNNYFYEPLINDIKDKFSIYIYLIILMTILMIILILLLIYDIFLRNC